MAIKTQYNANGQPGKVGQREYVWNALGQLVEIRQEQQGEPGKTHSLASYSYNHRAERVGKTVTRPASKSQTQHYLYEDGQLSAELDATGHITRQYLYLADQPIAVIDSPAGKSLSKEKLLTHYLFWLDAKTILKHYWLNSLGSLLGSQPSEHTAWLHTNHLGAPEAATDSKGQLVWQARYASFGAAKIVKASHTAKDSRTSFTLNLRLPGQYEDDETGLFYNKQRYYDPSSGEYLTPDPLGTPDGPNGYSYVRYNPLRYVDPDGLILFAFDGTGNDESTPNALSNVVNFRTLYQGDRFYISGPGTTDTRTGISGGFLDTGFSTTGKERIARLIQDLRLYSDTVDNNTAIDIDTIGFSRGAAQARDFANQIIADTKNGFYKYTDTEGVVQCQKLNFRFMGIWDTVLSTHRGSYNLAIPNEFKYVAHAVALNEYRNLFPSESIMQGQFSPVPVPNKVRIERGFLGSHSDIGGSFVDGDLARIALVWMVDQATAAGVSMSAPDRTIIANPVIHDKSSNLFAALGPAPNATSEDRVIKFKDGSSPRERTAIVNGMSFADTQRFITYSANPTGIVAGTVDARAYLEWLDRNGYNLNMTVQ